MRGNFQLTRKSRNSWWISGENVDAEGMVIKIARERSPETKQKRSQNDFAIMHILRSV